MNDYTPPPGYTPTDDEVQADFFNMGVIRDEENAETLDRWYRWLAEHDRLVEAQALEQAESIARRCEEDALMRRAADTRAEWWDGFARGAAAVSNRIRARAAEIREGRA